MNKINKIKNKIIIYSKDQEKVDYINNNTYDNDDDLYITFEVICGDVKEIEDKIKSGEVRLMTINEGIGHKYEEFYTSFNDFIFDPWTENDNDIIILAEDFDLEMLVCGLNNIAEEVNDDYREYQKW